MDEDALEGDKQKGKIKSEITTHVSIHTLHLDGLRELHRHFLRLPDGAIVEVRIALQCLSPLKAVDTIGHYTK